MASKKPVLNNTPSPATPNTRPGSITVTVTVGGDGVGVLRNASISVYKYIATPGATGCTGFSPDSWTPPQSTKPPRVERTDLEGQVCFEQLPPDCYVVCYGHYPVTPPKCVEVGPGCAEAVCFHLELGVRETTTFKSAAGHDLHIQQPTVGDRAYTLVDFKRDGFPPEAVTLGLPRGATLVDGEAFEFSTRIRNAGPNQLEIALRFAALSDAAGEASRDPAAIYLFVPKFDAEENEPTQIAGTVKVAMTRAETEATSDLKLWGAIRASTEALSFDNYLRFMDLLFCRGTLSKEENDTVKGLLKKRFLPFTDTDAYRVMKAATEAFVVVNCGVFTGAAAGFDNGSSGNNTAVLADLRDYLDRRDLPALGSAPYRENVDGIRMLPYLAIIRRKLPDVAINEPPLRGNDRNVELCEGFIQEKLANPCLLELIWSYWHEEGLLVQTMNAISRRFQNIRGPGQPDPLSNMEVNPLRPLNNLLWGYIQDEQHRLTVIRRHGEYHHHYGLQLEGRAVRGFRAADTRSTFIESFHRLLRLCTEFFKQDDQTTVKADAFGVLNALKEVHLTISEGAHSQFGDLPPTARVEMLMQQWLLSRPEFREFLPTRVMVAYPEPWMDRVDAMKKLQGWTDTSVMHFHNLAVFGEQILLAIRYGAWSVVFEPTQAFNFARFWRPQIQGYIHAYRAVTGVELGAQTVDTGVDATLPSVLLQKRLVAQQRSVLK